ncbi:MAG TPA: hypothetical protein PLV08_14395 [Flavobacteriales bacterium]|jgi:hypothetical protein|nr:hypothetical protein [Flavobacteriales bacterium]MBK7484264.1 hypothetical protein [Flavobacteriales bacterium]MBK7618240.1 hypothetical protein [Flavobacteriales bacterium]MBK8707531.1 hypothetical protein [Flavobacteriales bacterium]MBK9626138.1 hypothetical protein [Flavobacteriales bacterium]
MEEPRTIRCAVLCAAHTLPHWQGQAIRHLIELAGVELVAVGIPQTGRQHTPRTGFRGYLNHRSHHLISVRAAAPEDLSDLLAPLPNVELRTVDTRSISEELAPFAPDLVISFLPPLEQERGDPKLPIWQFVLNERGLGKDGMPAMDVKFTTLKDMPVQLVRVDRLGMVEATFPLRDEDLNPTIDPWLLGAAWLPSILISKLRRQPTEPFDKPSIDSHYKPELQRPISSLVALWLNLEYRRLKASKLPTPETGAWNIGILHQPITELLQDTPNMNVRWLPAPSEGNHRMEPFGYMAQDGQLNVLYRKRSVHSEQDIIARLRPKSDSVLKRSRSMLSTSASLTYPFVVERPDGAYAIIGYPHQRRTELFRVASTNDGMDHIKVLLNRALTNPTLTQFEDRWWLFGMDPDASGSVLLAYYADAFDGTYHPHHLNPLKVARSGCRPAGAFFSHEGTLWRPVMDASDPDIPAVVLSRVIRLTPNEFEEEPGNRISGFRGTSYAHGVRTLNAMGDITLIDGVRDATGERKRPKADPEKRRRSKHR